MGGGLGTGGIRFDRLLVSLNDKSMKAVLDVWGRVCDSEKTLVSSVRLKFSETL